MRWGGDYRCPWPHPYEGTELRDKNLLLLEAAENRSGPLGQTWALHQGLQLFLSAGTIMPPVWKMSSVSSPDLDIVC